MGINAVKGVEVGAGLGLLAVWIPVVVFAAQIFLG